LYKNENFEAIYIINILIQLLAIIFFCNKLFEHVFGDVHANEIELLYADNKIDRIMRWCNTKYIFSHIYIFSHLSTRSSYKRSKLDVGINISTLLYIIFHISYILFRNV